MRVVKFLLVCGLLIAGYQTTSKAEVALKPGMKFQNFIRPGETPLQVALPEGEWEIAAVKERTNNNDLKLLEVCLFQSSGNKLSKFIRFVASIEKAYGGGFESSRSCSRKDMHYINAKSNEGGENQDCRYVNHLIPYWLDSKSDFAKECAKIIYDQKIEFPNHAIQSFYRLTDDDNFLQVKYYFNPSTEGFEDLPKVKWRHSPWNKTGVASDPKKKAYVDGIINWTNTYYSTIKAGFSGSLTGGIIKKPTATPPPVTASSPNSSSAADRLKKLGALLKQELITEQEYEEKRKAILNSL